MIDLCVVSYNTSKLLYRFLSELHEDSGISDDVRPWKLYIADNNSEDDTLDMLRHTSSRFYIDNLFLNKNIGYSGACNIMGSRTKSDVIGFLNADVWLSTDDVRKIQNSFDSCPTIDILGPKQRDENKYIRHAGIIGTNTQPKHRGWNEHDPKDTLYRDVIECVTVSGSALFIRRSVWDALTNDEEYQKMYPGIPGAFLPTPHYYEETWLNYFARHRGYGVYYDGTISIGHSWHASSPKPGEGISKVDQLFSFSQSMFRSACDEIGIARD